MNKHTLRFLLPAVAVALLVSAAPAMAQKAAVDDDTWYSATAAGDACVPLAVVQQRLKTTLGFMVGPPWQTPSDVIYVIAASGNSARPVLITPNVKTFALGQGGTMTFIRGYQRCLAYDRSRGWTR